MVVNAIYPRLLLTCILLVCLFAATAVFFPLGLLLMVVTLMAFFKAKKYQLLLCYLLLLVLWQNTWIGFVSDLIPNKSTYSLMHGINFVIPLFLFFMILAVRRTIPHTYYKLWVLNLGILMILIAACIIGSFLYGFTYGISYLRLFLGPLLLFWAGFWLGDKTSEEDFTKVMKFIFYASMIVTAVQFVLPQVVIPLLNDEMYYGWKVGTENIQDVVGYLESNSYFNLPIGIKLARAGGLVKSFISNAYFLTILSVLLFWKRSKVVTWLFVFAISVCCASKGALLLFLFFNLFMFLRRTFSISVVLLFFVFIWSSIVYVGLMMRNEHMIAFMAGLDYFNTLGNGLGFSGNLSPVRLVSWNGPELPDLGYYTRFQNGSESALGVLFSSLGIFALLYVLYTFYLAMNVRGVLKENNEEYVAVMLLLMIMQGIFQEEAYSPFAFGLALLFAGYKAYHRTREA